MSGHLLFSLLGAFVICVTTLPSARTLDILIKNGVVVNADGRRTADVHIKEGLIYDVRDGIKAKGMEVIDAAGMLVMPGGIDPHTHLDAPMFGTVSCDDFASGQAAGLAGGTTMVIDFALPIEHDLQRGFKNYLTKTKSAVADYGLHMAVTRFDTKAAEDMAKLAFQGINSFKFFMAYKGSLQVTDEELVSGFDRCKEIGALPMVHAENGDGVLKAQQKTIAAGITGPEGHYISRPDFLEDEATYRAIKLAELVNVPLYVVHVMSSKAAEFVREARAAGQRVIGEAVSSGFAALEASVFHPKFEVAAQFVMSPPIRSPEHQRKLKYALAGQALQIVATDHCPFNKSQKAAGLEDFRRIPNGVNGIEERMHVTWETMVNSGLMTPSDFVRVTSTAAAQAFNIYPRKGVIAPGSDADIIIFDPHQRHTISAKSHHSAIDTNIYEGFQVMGKVVKTISRGKVVWDGKALHVREGEGQFVKCPKYGSLFEGLAVQDQNHLHEKYPYGSIPIKRSLYHGKSQKTEL